MRKKRDDMKRMFIFAAALVMAGCSGDLPLDPGTGALSDIVAFSTGTATRGTPVDDVSELTDIGTFGYYTGQSGWTAASLPNRMFNRRLYRDGAAWRYDGDPVAWNGSAASDRFTFYAYAPYATADNGIVVQGDDTSGGIPTLTYTVPTDVTKQPDLMVAVPRIDITKPASGFVSLDMQHALTTIGFQVAGDGEQITGLTVSGVSMTGTLEMNGSDIEWTNLDTPPSADFTASINFDAGQNYYTATPTMSTNLMKGDGYLMMIPQILGDDAVLVVSYADGTSIDINIDPHEWLPGKRIIYELTIVQGGVIVVEPSEITMPFIASRSRITVDCSNLQGNPNPSLPWTLTTSAPWLTLSLGSDGTNASQTLDDAGSHTVYVFSTANNTGADRTATITLNGDENVVTTVRQHHSAAQGFARSNIVMVIDGNGNKILTFAETELDHTEAKSVTYYDASTSSTVTGTVPAIAANVQGLHFRWGSLVGITSDSSNAAFNGGTSGVAPSSVVFWPAEYAPNVPGRWVFDYNGMSATGQVPYIDDTEIGTNSVGSAQYAFAGYPGGAGPGFDAAAGKGDICRYISEMGWVKGRWRMPTTAEIAALLNETPIGNNGRAVGSWDGATVTGTGSVNRYGYFSELGARLVGAGVTGFELGSNSLPNPGPRRVAFPAAGWRSGYDGRLYDPGHYAFHWSATASSFFDFAYVLDFNGYNNVHPANNFSRNNGYSVRCIMAE